MVGELISFIFTLVFLLILSLVPATLIAAVLSLNNIRVKYRRALPLSGWSLEGGKYIVQSTEARKWLLRLVLLSSMLTKGVSTLMDDVTNYYKSTDPL